MSFCSTQKHYNSQDLYLDETQGGGCSDFIEEFIQFVYVDDFLVKKKLVHLACYQSFSVQLCLIHLTVDVIFEGVHRLGQSFFIVRYPVEVDVDGSKVLIGGFAKFL